MRTTTPEWAETRQESKQRRPSFRVRTDCTHAIAARKRPTTQEAQPTNPPYPFSAAENSSRSQSQHPLGLTIVTNLYKSHNKLVNPRPPPAPTPPPSNNATSVSTSRTSGMSASKQSFRWICALDMYAPAEDWSPQKTAPTATQPSRTALRAWYVFSSAYRARQASGGSIRTCMLMLCALCVPYMLAVGRRATVSACT